MTQHCANLHVHVERLPYRASSTRSAAWLLLIDRRALSSTSTSCSSNKKSRTTRSRCRAACCSASATKRCRRSSAAPQFALTELLLCDEVDRIIFKRLRLPAYDTWRRRRVKLIDELRRPEHWGLRPDDVLVRALPISQRRPRARRRRARRDVGALSRRQRLRRHDAAPEVDAARARDAGGDRRGARRARARADRRLVVVRRRTMPLNAVIVNPSALDDAVSRASARE